jgi:hypothetical protein
MSFVSEEIASLAVALTEKAGLDPDQPRHLSRSVILSPAS